MEWNEEGQNTWSVHSPITTRSIYISKYSSNQTVSTHPRVVSTLGEFSFMGAHIVDEVIKDLAEQHNLASARLVLLAGSSAGGTGVLLSLDRVAAQISRLARQVEVRGITDSGWFLDNAQYKPAICMDAHTCAPVDGIRKGTQWVLRNSVLRNQQLMALLAL